MSKQTTNLQTITKVFTPETWWEFQKQDAMVEWLDTETVLKMDGYKEIRVTFVWDASKAKHQ